MMVQRKGRKLEGCFRTGSVKSCKRSNIFECTMLDRQVRKKKGCFRTGRIEHCKRSNIVKCMTVQRKGGKLEGCFRTRRIGCGERSNIAKSMMLHRKGRKREGCFRKQASTMVTKLRSTIVVVLLLFFCTIVTAETDTKDLMVLRAFLQGLNSTDKLKWTGNDPCGTDKWQGIKCSGISVSSINLAGLDLSGTITPQLNQLTSLSSLSLQRNRFSGTLPNLSGLTKLQCLYLQDNSFDIIPTGFFANLAALKQFYLSNSILNKSAGGWVLSSDLQSSTQLAELSLTNTSLVGGIPDFLGTMGNLKVLGLAYNRLGGGIPLSFSASNLLRFQANNQFGPQISGTIDVIASMQSLTVLWLHENNFSGTIPQGLGKAVSLSDLRLNGNHLVGPIPSSFVKLPLTVLAVENNELDGPIPLLTGNITFTYQNNYFCQSTSGVECSVPVTVLLSFLGLVNYPSNIVGSWKGNNPCKSWIGITCDSNGVVSVINLANSDLSGTISPALGQLFSLTVLKLNGNNLTGIIPSNLTTLRNLKTLDVSNNNLTGPVPVFPSQVVVNVTGNPFINMVISPSSSTGVIPGEPSLGNVSQRVHSSSISNATIVGIILGIITSLCLIALACFLFYKKYPNKFESCQHFNKLPKDDSANRKTIDPNISGADISHLAFSMTSLQNATCNFSDVNLLGKGGFGHVYKGQLADGMTVAVKRMEATAITNKGLKEFQAEIDVLTKVRHRHLVALLGYCIEGNEKLLVYEHVPQGSLSRHLFDWQTHGLKPLTWKSRLVISLDVARGLEYLHGLAHVSFIHRDMKSSNILLDDNFRAKIADFGLVKLAPCDGKLSVETRLAGTFGYLAPEYATTGRITTKVDVYSFGVVLMEIITGRKALEGSETEDQFHLVSWFRPFIGDKSSLMKALDPVLEVNDDSFQSILIVAQLAGHCTIWEPHCRPDMRHAVNVLASLTEGWKPTDVIEDEPEMTYEHAWNKWELLDDSSSFSRNVTNIHSSNSLVFFWSKHFCS